MRIFIPLLSAVAITIGVIAAPASANEDLSSWKTAVVKAVAKKQRYPRSALAREIEGKAKVRLVVRADGTIANHEVVEATGESILDKEIPRLVKRLNPLPSLPAGREELSFVLPLDWSLN